jgi:hypothetical protein
VASWHAQIGHPTIADSILDRLVHKAHRIELISTKVVGSKFDGGVNGRTRIPAKGHIVRAITSVQISCLPAFCALKTMDITQL